MSAQTNGLLPSFYDPANNVWGYSPNLAKVFAEAQVWQKKFNIRPSSTDHMKVGMLNIDDQGDFCYPQGTLYVGGRSGNGAIDDSRRKTEFIYRNLHRIMKLMWSMDTHFAWQIFFPTAWMKADGTPVDAHTMSISVESIDVGEFRINPRFAAALSIDYMWLVAQARFYCEELKKAGKYSLYIWPFHCMLGTIGHALVGILEEANMFHAFVRASQNAKEIKGGHPLTENYSILRPEVLVRWDGKPLAQKNTVFIQHLLEFDRLILAGQAASHCVASSIDDLLSEILAHDPALARKVYILSDCTSAVAVPDGKGGFYADFTPQAEAAMQRFVNAGMHLVKSTDEMDSWPDFNS